jgi:hypothetical protein
MKLLAPNGKQSNLNPEQYRLVRTTTFKSWFGDWENTPEKASKVVDANGEPLVVWHGTYKEFNVFGEGQRFNNIEHIKNTNYFHKSKKYAEKFGFEKPYFLNIKNIELIEQSTMEKLGYFKEVYDQYVLNGIDGVYTENGEYATLISSNQIKLADGSNTTFDGSNPDIRFDVGGELEKDSIVNWHKLSGNNTKWFKQALAKDLFSKYRISVISLSFVKTYPNREKSYFKVVLQPEGYSNNIVFKTYGKTRNEHIQSIYDYCETLDVQEMKNGGQTLYNKPEPKYEDGEVLDLKGYGKVKILGSAWLTPPMTARPQYIYDFLLNHTAKITKFKKNDFSLYEYEVDMMLSDVDTGIDYEKSYEKYLGSGLRATGNPPLEYIKFIEVINRSLYYKNHPEFELNPPVKNFYEAYAVENGTVFGIGGQTKNAKMKKRTSRLTPKEVKGKVELISGKIDEIKKILKWHEGKEVAYPLTETEIKILNDGLPELRKERERIWKIYEDIKDKKQGTISDDLVQIKTFDIKFNYVYRILDAKYIVNYLRLNKKNKIDDKFYSSYEIQTTENDIGKFTLMLSEKIGDYSDYINYLKINANEKAERFSTPQVVLQWDSNNFLIVELSEYLSGLVTKYDDAKVIYSTAPFEIPKIRTEIEVELDPMIKQAVRDVIYLDKYSKLTDEEGYFLYSKFKEYETLIDEYGEYVAKVKEPIGEKKIEEFNEFMEMLDHKQFIYHSSYDETIEAYQKTIDFINAVRGRIETLKAKQSGMDLFPETEINILRKSDVEDGVKSLETLLEIEPDNQEYKDALESLKVLLETSFDNGGELTDRVVLEQSVSERVRYEPDKDYLDDIDIKAISDILLLPKYRNISEEEAQFLYKSFYNYESKRNKQGNFIYQIKWKYSYGSNDKNARKEDEALKKFIERMDRDGIITFNNYDGVIEADKTVIDFVNSVRNRVKTIINKKSIGDTSIVNRVSVVDKNEVLQAIESLEVLSELEPDNQEYKDGIESLKILLETLSFEEGGEIKYYEVQKEGRPVLKAKFKKADEENIKSTSKMLDSLSDRGYSLKEITEKDYRTFNYSNVKPEDMVEFTQGAEYFANGGKIEFDKNKVPSTRIYNYAVKLKREHPEIWKLGGNIFGNQAFKNLEKVIKRGYWLDSEKWMFIKWRGYVARHQADFRIEGVIAMLKWIDTVDKGWDYMKETIENEINPKVTMKEGGETEKSNNVTVEARTENGLEFDFEINENANVSDVIDLAKQKCSPQNLKWFKFKGTKYTVETI